LYYGYQLLGGEDLESALEASMSVELVHTALLMHDDFMDADKIRRGQPTSQVVFQKQHQENNWRGDPVHFGEAMAVDVGDIALLAGYEILASSNFPPQRRLKAMQSMLRGIVNTGIGQAFDLSLQAAGGYEKDVFDLHWAKTAIYTYENPLHVGAILAGAKKSDLALLSQYARSGGVAFQLQDDILGLFGNPQETGKSDNSDLVQGKVTQLVVKAIELADSKQKQTLLELWGKEDLSESEAEQIRKIVKDTGSLEHSRSSAIKFAQEARVITTSMRKLGWNKEAVDYLEGIAVYMIERSV
jgi:geranylgeranyl diphosphate synthase type I